MWRRSFHSQIRRNLCSFLEYVVVQTLAKLSKRNQAMFNDEYKSFQKQVKRMTY